MNIQSIFSTILFVGMAIFIHSCSTEAIGNDPLEEAPEELTVEEGILLQVVTTKAALEVVIAQIFKYPNLTADFTGELHIQNRNECPSISPDPSLTITNFPITFNMEFPEEGCTPIGARNNISGAVELTLDGPISEELGTQARINFKNNFKMDDVDLDGVIDLVYAGLDDNGNKTFDSEIKNLKIKNINNDIIKVKNTTGGKLALIDPSNNNDPSNYISYIDDYSSQSYTSMEVVFNGTKVSLSTTSDLKAGPLCICPTEGVLEGTVNGKAILIDFEPNSDCTGEVLIEGEAISMAACNN